jgi:hypothetical protein
MIRVKKRKHGAHAGFRRDAEARAARAPPRRAASHNMPVRNLAIVVLLAAASFFVGFAGEMVTFPETHDQATYPSEFVTLTGATYPVGPSEVKALAEFKAAIAEAHPHLRIDPFYDNLGTFPEMNDLAVTAAENATESTSTLLVYDGAAVVAGASSGTPFLFEFATACVLSFSPKARRSSPLALTAAVLGASCVRAEDEENQPPGSAEKKKKKRARIVRALDPNITVIDAEDLLAQLAAAQSSTTTTPAVEQPSTTTTPAVEQPPEIDSPLLQVMGNTLAHEGVLPYMLGILPNCAFAHLAPLGWVSAAPTNLYVTFNGGQALAAYFGSWAAPGAPNSVGGDNVVFAVSGLGEYAGQFPQEFPTPTSTHTYEGDLIPQPVTVNEFAAAFLPMSLITVPPLPPTALVIALGDRPHTFFESGTFVQVTQHAAILLNGNGANVIFATLDTHPHSLAYFDQDGHASMSDVHLNPGAYHNGSSAGAAFAAALMGNGGLLPTSVPIIIVPLGLQANHAAPNVANQLHSALGNDVIIAPSIGHTTSMSYVAGSTIATMAGSC